MYSILFPKCFSFDRHLKISLLLPRLRPPLTELCEASPSPKDGDPKKKAGGWLSPRALFEVVFAIQKATLHTDDRHGYGLLQGALCYKYPLILVGHSFQKPNIFYSGLQSQSLQNLKYNPYLFSVRSVFIRKEDKIYSL